MPDFEKPVLDRVYSAKTDEESRSAYNDWASDYDADLTAFGYTLPGVATGVICRFVYPGLGGVLDAGCGTGLLGAYLKILGFGPITGIDLSEGMLDVARGKGVYDDLRRMRLGASLAFADDQFFATVSTGTLTPGHAPATAFDELIRVTASGGFLVFSLRADGDNAAPFRDALERHEGAERISFAYKTESFPAMPLAEPEVMNRIFVYKVI